MPKRHPVKQQLTRDPDFKVRRKKPFILYHWSPTSRRKSIQKHGLQVGRKHITHTKIKGWQADYLCFSDSPSLAWALSGAWFPRADTKKGWDLWMTWSNNMSDLQWRGDHYLQQPAEFRSKTSLNPDQIWLVGTRTKR